MHRRSQEFTGFSLILFDLWMGNDCHTSCVSIIIKQRGFVTFPASDSAWRGLLIKRLIPPTRTPQGHHGICCVY